MKCFCGGTPAQRKISGTDFLECPVCHLMKKVNIPSEKEEKQRYDLHVVDEAYITYMKGIYEKIKPYLSDGRCLDFGCGKIHCLSDILNEDGRNACYYDLYYYPEMPQGFFDDIILIEVFEHIADSCGLLLSLREKLTEKGRIIIMTKTIPDNPENWWYFRDVTHVTFVRPETMDILAGKCGMNCRFIEKDSFFVLSLK